MTKAEHPIIFSAPMVRRMRARFTTDGTVCCLECNTGDSWWNSGEEESHEDDCPLKDNAETTENS